MTPTLHLQIAASLHVESDETSLIESRCIGLKPFSPDKEISLAFSSMSESSLEARFQATAIIVNEPFKCVYRGKLHLNGEAVAKDVVCKLLLQNEADEDQYMSRINTEAGHYEEGLMPARGQYTALYYGAYQGEFDKKKAACVLLEDCGKSLPDSYIGPLRVKGAQALLAIHRTHGISQGPLGKGSRGLYTLRNIVTRSLKPDARVVIVNFDQAEKHMCELGDDSIKRWTHRPKPHSFHCMEMLVACDYAEKPRDFKKRDDPDEEPDPDEKLQWIWLSSDVPYAGQQVSIYNKNFEPSNAFSLARISAVDRVPSPAELTTAQTSLDEWNEDRMPYARWVFGEDVEFLRPLQLNESNENSAIEV